VSYCGKSNQRIDNVKNTPKTRKSRLFVIAATPLILFAGYGATVYIEAQSKQQAFDQRLQGMTGYEVCQVAYEEFGIDMAKEVGCLDNLEAITDAGE